jgi:hypothetical protein
MVWLVGSPNARVPELSRIVLGAPPQPVRGGGNVRSFLRCSSPESDSSPTGNYFLDDGQERSEEKLMVARKNVLQLGCVARDMSLN